MSVVIKREFRLRYAMLIAFSAGALLARGADTTAPSHFKPARIAVLGDSFSERGWPNLLAGDGRYPGTGWSNSIDRIWPGCVISNFAVGGAHASGWLGIQTNAQGKFVGNGARMFRTNWPALLAFNPDLTVVFIGGNDFNEGRGVSIGTITNRIALLIDRLRARNPRMAIVLGSYHDGYDGLSLAAIAHDRYTNASLAVKLLCDSDEKLARDKGCESVCRTIYDSFMNHCWGTNLGGAIHLEPTYSRPYNPLKADQHPSPAGQEKLAEIFYNKFRQMAAAAP